MIVILPFMLFGGIRECPDPDPSESKGFQEWLKQLDSNKKSNLLAAIDIFLSSRDGIRLLEMSNPAYRGLSESEISELKKCLFEIGVLLRK